jgi:hypothetical protein
MQTFKTETRLDTEGRLQLNALPFHPGADVEVVVRYSEPQPEARKRDRYPLRGESIEYDDPTSPVAEEDWEALRR